MIGRTAQAIAGGHMLKSAPASLLALALLTIPAKAEVVAHPQGCPKRLFCGCGVSVKIFGKPVRELFLARNWFKFPKTRPAPGMVAVRRGGGHVMVIQAIDANGNAVVYDPNSGNHKTRVHTRSLAGFVVVNPHGGG
jgi:hypothetical protein